MAQEEVAILLPSPLSALLEDDCFWILRRDKLLHLPADFTVEGFLKEYYFHCLENSNEDTNLQLLSEVLDGLKVYFDFTLEHLLYGPEKEQYKRLGVLNPVLSKKPPNTHACSAPGDCSCGHVCGVPEQGPCMCGHLPSQVYGPIHLLRLFVKLPHFLMCAQVPANHVQLLHLHFRDMFVYMCARKQELFPDTHYYETLPSLHTNSNNIDGTDSEHISVQ